MGIIDRASVLIGLIIYVGVKEITDWFNAANISEVKPYDGVELSRKNTSSVDASFASGK